MGVTPPTVTISPSKKMNFAQKDRVWSSQPVKITVQTFEGDTLSAVNYIQGIVINPVIENPSPFIYELWFTTDKTTENFPVGTTTQIYNVVDSSGNMSQLTFDVTAIPNTHTTLAIELDANVVSGGIATVQHGTQGSQVVGTAVVTANDDSIVRVRNLSTLGDGTPDGKTILSKNQDNILGETVPSFQIVITKIGDLPV